MCGRGHALHGGGHAWQGGHAWHDTTRYGDAVNEQAVRILLECILVQYNFVFRIHPNSMYF